MNILIITVLIIITCAAVASSVKLINYLNERKSVDKEKEQMRAQLIQSAKLASIGTLVSSIAHELNNPLTSIIGHSQLLKTVKNNPQKIVDKADVINNASLRMKSIIDHLRTFARKSKNSDWRLLEISRPINNAMGFLKKQLELNGIAVSVSFTDSLSNVSGDMIQLESVFQNLLVNSKDAFEEVKDNRKKLIKISSLVEGETIKIIFEDNAVGMTKNKLNKIFDPFYTTKEAGKGTGLGLSITKNIIDEHKGTILVKSDSGKGTQFIITFPLEKDCELSNLSMHGELPSTISLKKEDQKRAKILIIDDEPEVVELLYECMGEPFDTYTVVDPLKAIELIEEKEFDLILTDLKMPKASGLDVLWQAKKNQPKTPVVIMSGFGKDNKELKYALSQGAKGYIPKPFGDSDELINCLESHIKTSELA